MDGNTQLVLLTPPPSSDSAPVISAPLLLGEVLAGYDFVRCLERTPLREVWRVTAPGGRPRVAQLLRGVGTADDRWLDRLLGVTDPALPRLEAVRISAGQTVLLTDPWRSTLLDRFRECRARGLPGVPRDELLGHLRQAAHILDILQRFHRIQHLNLSPANLLLKPPGLQVEGFGLAQLLWLPARVPVTQLHADYAARELLFGRISSHCDQYSLALIFAELLTGEHPVRGVARRNRLTREPRAPRLDGLTGPDRVILARALDPHPQRRFANSPELFRALTDATPPEAGPALAPVIVLRGDEQVPAGEPLHGRLWTRAGSGLGVEAAANLRYLLKPGERLEHHCAARFYRGAALLRLEAFRQHWGGRTLRLTETEFRFALALGRQGWFGRAVGLEVHVGLTPIPQVAPLHRVQLSLTPFGCRGAEAVALLADWGPRLLVSVRDHLQVEAEQRRQERLRWHQPLRLHPVADGHRLSAAIEGVAKDISPRGVGLYVPRQLAGREVYVQWPDQPDLADLAALARVVRGRSCGDGWFEVGVVFE